MKLCKKKCLLTVAFMIMDKHNNLLRMNKLILTNSKALTYVNK